MSANIPTQTLNSSAARDPQVQSIAAALSAPFAVRDIKFKPQMVKNNRCLAMAYIDARLIQDRLDEVVGVENWQDTYDLLSDGSVMCRLRVKLGGRWITKTDVGSPSAQPDAGDRLKAAFSDGLKRAAVKFGIGRYLYRLPAQWVDYDPVKKQMTQLPQLPASAIPKSGSGRSKSDGGSESGRSKTGAFMTSATATSTVTPALPENGQELHRRLQEYDAKLAAKKVCGRGALLAHVTQAGVKAGYAANLADWIGPAIPFAVEVVKEFEQSMRGSSKSEPRNAA